MNETERQALVETINTELMRAQGEYGQDHYYFGASSDRIMSHIDRLLAAAAAPGLDDDAVERAATSIARQIRIAGMHVTDFSGKKVYPDWLGIVQAALAAAGITGAGQGEGEGE